MATLPLLDLQQFHQVDRDLFSRLVINLSRDPAESFLAMAFWLWLEDQNVHGIVTRFLKVSRFVLGKVADEAIICLNSLAAGQPVPPTSNTAFTTSVLEKTIPLDMMHADKASTIDGIRYFIDKVCARIFTDILEQALVPFVPVTPFYRRLNVPGFPHPIFGDVDIMKLPLDEQFLIEDLWGWGTIPFPASNMISGRPASM